MIAIYQKRLNTFPIVSSEDGLDENDWAGFARQAAAQGGRIQIVRDDNFVTNPKFFALGIKEKTANAALIKLNQIGTVTETFRRSRSAARTDGAMSPRIAPARRRTHFLPTSPWRWVAGRLRRVR